MSSWWRSLAKYAAPVVGAIGGAAGGGALGLSPALGGAIGGALGGFAGGEIGGSSLKGSLLEAGLGGVGGYLAGPTIADWTGTTPLTAAAAAPGFGGGMQNYDQLLNTIGQGSAQSASIPAQALSGGLAGAAGAGAGAAAGGAAGAIAPGIGGATVSGINDFFGKNPELLAGAAGLGSLAMNQGGGEYPAEKALEQQAKMLGAQGQAGLNGTLSPSAAVAFQDAETTIRASYANMGLSGSTMEAQDIEAARQRAISASVTEGMQQLGMSQSLYSAILGYQQQQDSDLSNAIANLMGSIGYGQGTQGTQH
jgi:hypothetical protein